MRRLATLSLLALLVIPSVGSAQVGTERPSATKKKSAKKKRGKKAKPAPAPTPAPQAEEPEAPATAAPAPTSEPDDPADALFGPGTTPAATPAPTAATPAPDAPRQDAQAQTSAPAAAVQTTPAVAPSHRHRYAFVAGGALAAGGAAFGYWAQGETRRAETMSTAREAERVLDGARKSAATANLLYALAAVTVGYGLVMELLPDDVAEKATLTFHF